MKRAVACCLVVALALGCRDQRSLTSPKTHGISGDIVDGAHGGGNPHFFFLPPLVPQPSFSGVFNPNLGPVVQICTLTTAGTGCDPAIAPINPGAVQLDAPDQLYQVNWHTDSTNVGTTSTYRIQVIVANEVLGFADVQPVSNGSALKNLQTGDVIGLVDGRTLPIKLRIENGALCFGQLDCGEGTVGPAGGTIVTQNLMAGVLFPAGALSNTVTVVIAQVTSQPCLPVDLVQREGCYNFVTTPPGQFLTNVTVAICVDVESLGTLTNNEKSLLHLERLDFVEGQPVVTPLPNASAGFLPCNATETFPPLGLKGRGSDRWLALAKAGTQRLVSLLLPRNLYALHLGVGGSTCCFSQIGWALPSTMTLQAGDGQTAVSGTAVAIPPAVVLRDSGGGPIPGEKVTFSVAAGGGTVNAATVTTALKTGTAATAWTLGTADGTSNTLTAASAGAVGSPITFHATGVTITALVTEAPPSDATPSGLAAVPVSPNLDTAQATAGGGNLTLTIRFRAGTFDSTTSHVVVNLDTDQNAATGFAGVDGAHNDATIFGTDYLVELGSNSENGRASVYKFTGATQLTNSFALVATVPATVLKAVDNSPEGVQTTVPLALLGPSNGQMNLKIVVQAQDLSLPTVGYTGILDYLPNLGLAPGSLTLPSP